MRFALAGLLAGLLLPGIAVGQAAPNPNILVTFTFREISGQTGFDETTTLTCRGLPTCTGTYTTVVRFENCTNFNTFTGTGGIANLVLGPATATGTITFSPGFYNFTRNANGSCTLTSPTPTESFAFTTSWNAATGTGTGTLSTGTTTITTTTAPAPVFPMTVQSSINAQTATATAIIQPRAEDVGRSVSVYAFASAPVSRVQGALAAKAIQLGMSTGGPKADPVPCVLAQVSPQGLLQAVTTSQLTALFTGVLSTAGTSANILNNTPTPNVAGATIYVGYGGTSQSMLDNGIFRNAVLIPGDTVCPPLPYATALWLHPQEAGWGLNVIQQGSIAFATLFTYDVSRQPLWLLMSGGQLQSDGLTFSGDLYRTIGPAFSASPFTPIGAANYTRVGTMSMTLSDANSAQLRYSVNGAEVQKSIQRFVFGSHAANCLPTSDSRATSTNYTDLWWKADESGWGLNITHQDNILFGTLFTYSAGAGSSNQGLWLVMSNGNRQADGSYSGELRRTTGPAFNAVPFTPITAADQTVVGTMRLRFSDGNNGILNYSVNGVNVEKPITRIPFATPVAACN